MLAAISDVTAFWYGLFGDIPDTTVRVGLAVIAAFGLLALLLKALAPGVGWLVGSVGPIVVRVVTGMLLYPEWLVSRQLARAAKPIPAEIRTYGVAVEEFETWFTTAFTVLSDAIKGLGRKGWWASAVVVALLVILARSSAGLA